MKLKSLIVLFAALAFAVSPFLNPEFGGFDASLYPIPQDDPPVQPAGYAFAIWGVIYLWLIVHAVMGVWAYAEDPVWDETRVPLLISLGVGVFWLPVALISPLWATVMIWVMLLSALWSVFLAGPGGPKWALQLPLGLYSGWLSAASFVALGMSGAGYGIAFGETGWAVMALILATGFVVMTQQTLQRIWTYGFAAGWGIVAIAVANYATLPLVAALAGVAALLVAGVVLRQIMR
ncbi:MAG: hypothetical protein AAGA08_04945 [Pseudomonadota bacterium]